MVVKPGAEAGTPRGRTRHWLSLEVKGGAAGGWVRERGVGSLAVEVTQLHWNINTGFQREMSERASRQILHLPEKRWNQGGETVCPK